MMEHIDDEANENEFPIKLLRWVHLKINLLRMVEIQQDKINTAESAFILLIIVC